MKKAKALISVLMLAIFMGASLDVYAVNLDYTRFRELNIDHAYIVGDYIFNTDYGYSPTLKDIMHASRSIPEGEETTLYEVLSTPDLFIYQMEVYRQEIISDVNNFKPLNVRYVYRNSIDEASEEEYDELA